MSRIVKVGLLALVAGVLSAGSASAAPYAPHQVIVKPSRAGSALGPAAFADRLGLGRQVARVRRVGAQVFVVSADPRQVATRLRGSRLVTYAEPNFILRASAIPNDPMFGQLYGLHNTGQTGGAADADIDAPEGWDAAGLGSFPSTGGAKVGIVDTGIRSTHEDLAGKVANCAQSIGVIPGVIAGSIREGACTDDNGHGTHVAGTVTANANNGKGVAGVAFNSPLAICRALSGPLGVGTTADVANCITWVHDKGAKVISMSLGGGASTTLQQAVNYAWKSGGAAGSVLVAAAGNDGDATLNYPAAYGNVVSVAATDNRDQRASFSNANADVEVAAPGVDVLSSYNSSNTSYTTLSGTSMATPHASGVAAVIRALQPALTAAQVVARLDAATDDLGAAGRDPSYGFGRVNLFKAATG
jgi:thermitase